MDKRVVAEAVRPKYCKAKAVCIRHDLYNSPAREAQNELSTDCPRPESRDHPLLVTLLKNDIHLNLGKEIGVMFGRFEGFFVHIPLLCHDCYFVLRFCACSPA